MSRLSERQVEAAVAPTRKARRDRAAEARGSDLIAKLQAAADQADDTSARVDLTGLDPEERRRRLFG